MNADLSSSSSIPSTGVNPEQDISRKGNFLMDEGFVYITLGFAVIAAGLIFWMAAIITQKAWPALQTFGISFIWSTDWSVPAEKFGALPYIFGTLVTAGIALLLAVPIGISVALITSENFLPQWVRTPLGFIVELIAAIPSVIIGLWGIFVFIPVFLPVQQFLHQTLGWFPLFSSEPPGPGILVAGLILTVMILPTISSISRDVLRSVPVTLRSASMALGATRWETIFRVMLPAAASGIVGASILGLGRALGETMAVAMVIGNTKRITPSLLDSASTIPAVLANEFAESHEGLHLQSLMLLGVILFILTLAVNIAAVWIIQALSLKGRE